MRRTMKQIYSAPHCRMLRIEPTVILSGSEDTSKPLSISEEEVEEQGAKSFGFEEDWNNEENQYE
jgi:hypothetical protein